MTTTRRLSLNRKKLLKPTFVMLGTVGLALGAVVAFRADSANAILGVSLVLLIVAYLGDRLEKFTLRHGETEFSGEINKSVTTVKEEASEIESAVQEAIAALTQRETPPTGADATAEPGSSIPSIDLPQSFLDSLNRMNESLSKIKVASADLDRAARTVSASHSLASPISVFALRVFLNDAPDDAEVSLDRSDPKNPMLEIKWPK